MYLLYASNFLVIASNGDIIKIVNNIIVPLKIVFAAEIGAPKRSDTACLFVVRNSFKILTPAVTVDKPSFVKIDGNRIR